MHDILFIINIRKQSKAISTGGTVMSTPADFGQMQVSPGYAYASALKLLGLQMAAV